MNYLSYKYQQPLYYKHQRVKFYTHMHGIKYGTIYKITTQYDKNNNAYHIYSIDVEGWKRDQHVKENNIINYIPKKLED